MKILCITDGFDSDGRLSALIVRDYYLADDNRVDTIFLSRDRKKMNAPLWDVNFNYEIPAVAIDFIETCKQYDKVFFTDICLEIDIMDKISKVTNLTICDHHQTVIDNINKTYISNYTTTNNSRCGAMVTFLELHGTKKQPLLLKYVQDRDLFIKDFEHCDAVFTALKSTNDEVFLKSYLSDIFFNINVLSRGIKLYKEYLKEIKEIISSTVKVGIFDGHKALIAINCNGGFISDVGNFSLLTTPHKVDFFVNIKEKEDTISYSFRSLGFDVCKLARQLGGGGHRCASGGRVPKDNAVRYTIF